MSLRSPMLWGLWGMLFFLGIGPILKMLYVSLASLLGHHTVELTGFQESFYHSLLLALTVATSTTLLGTLLAFLLVKTDLHYMQGVILLLLIPLLLPPHIVALGWTSLIGHQGLLASFFYGFGGTAWILFGIYLPIPLLIIAFFLRKIPASLEESALLYTDLRGVVRHIDLPLVMPAILLSFLLIFILSFGEYSVANTLHYPVFALEIFTQFSAFYDFQGAMIMALPMLLIAVLVLGLERLIRRRNPIGYTLESHPPLKRRLTHRQRGVYGAMLALLILLLVIAPLWGILSKIDSFERIVDVWDQIFIPLKHSLIVALFSGFLLSLLGFVYGYALRYLPIHYPRWINTSLLFFLILPSILLAIALILFYNTPWTQWVYAGIPIVLIAITAKYLILPAKLIEIGLRRIPASLKEAAEVHGATPLQTLWYILLPLSRGLLGISFLIGSLFALRESTLTMLLYPPGFVTLPVYITTRSANANPHMIAAMSLWMILPVLLALGLLIPLLRRYRDML